MNRDAKRFVLIADWIDLVQDTGRLPKPSQSREVQKWLRHWAAITSNEDAALTQAIINGRNRKLRQIIGLFLVSIKYWAITFLESK